jgi:regulator of protease activity HflC (stomatin/prohibitin superfamily)
MDTTQIGTIVVVAVIVLLAILVVFRSVKIVPQARAAIVQRLGRYHKTLEAGLNVVVPFVDQVLPLIDLREQVISFPPQPVITQDNLVVSIDTVIFFQVTDPKAATFEIANYVQAIEQLTTTTLRNVAGGMDLERALTSREEINAQLRGVLDEATGKWGIRVNRVEIKAIDPPSTVVQAMELQMKAEREKRAAILQAEGLRQSAILTAEGQKQSAILNAEGDARAAVLRADGEAQAIQTVFASIHSADPDPKLLAYQYLQALPQIAAGPSNKMWILPAELTQAMARLGAAFGRDDRSDASP